MDIRQQILSRLHGFDPAVEILEPDQTVEDIIRAVIYYHLHCKDQYDRIADLFYSDGMSDRDVLVGLWNTCKRYLRYNEESEEDQRVSTPGTIFRRGWSDCKCYALFIAGVID